jgi:hypothetical protein
VGVQRNCVSYESQISVLRNLHLKNEENGFLKYFFPYQNIIEMNLLTKLYSRPRHSSSGSSLASQRGGPASNPGLVKWDLWWTKWRWDRFSPSISVSPANLHSTIFPIIIITRGRYNRPFSGRRAEWTQLGLHPQLCESNKFEQRSCWYY